MANLQALKAELDAGHPVTGAYSANSEAAAEETEASGSAESGWEEEEEVVVVGGTGV